MQRFFLVILCFLCLFSCKKKEPTQQNPCEHATNIIPIDESMKGFFFLPNSYWIYKNDSLNTFDSVVIKSVQVGCEYDEGPHTEYYCDYFIMNYKSFPTGYQYYDCIEGNGLMRNYHPYQVLWYRGWQLFGPADIDSIKVGNNMFYQLHKSYSAGTENNNEALIVYTAKDTGIVRREGDNGIWNLVRWKIYK